MHLAELFSERIPFRPFLCYLLMVLCFTFHAHSQFSIRDYTMTTGTNQSLWITQNNPECSPSMLNTPLEIGFDFFFMGRYYSQYVIGLHGEIYLSSIPSNPDYPTYLPFSSENNIIKPIIAPFGCRNWIDASTSICYSTIGTPGNRILVVTFNVAPTINHTPHNVYQLQMSEADGSILFIYEPHNDTNTYIDPQCGFAASNNSIHWVALSNHRHYFGKNNADLMMVWPRNYRYYRFEPESQPPCPMTNNIQISAVTAFSARISWDPTPGAISYRIHYYASDDSAATARTATVSQNTYLIENLRDDMRYQVNVKVVCSLGGTSIPIAASFRTVCLSYHNNPIKYADLTAPNVTCRTGSFLSPSDVEGIVDFGPRSIYSRHTVHSDINELDSNTGNNLKVIPDGFCRVVRLGNAYPGAQQEDITYDILVDTNDFDLILLRYAIVEENPYHSPDEQPKFILSILDSSGNVLSSCNERNFVAGINASSSDWNTYSSEYSEINWHNWDAMGIDLSAYQGQHIFFNISNYDCKQNGHFGYGYFTLEGTTKKFTTNTCGDFDSITFTAPEGFDYRWYKRTNPNITLSTNQSYTIRGSGTYSCRASFIGAAGANCGFTITTTIAPRYPYASIAYETISDCGNEIHFFNNSCIANDALHTQLTHERCDSITWIFDDGYTSTLNNPTHRFAPGDHQVSLIASLAHGQCNDTATVHFHIDVPIDTITRYFCPGKMFQYNGIYFSDTGYYVFDTACTYYVLHLCHYPVYHDTLVDQFCLGGSYSFLNHSYTQPGEYIFSVPDVHGCDSSFHLMLSVFVADSSVFDEAICEGTNFIFQNQPYSHSGTYIDTIETNHGCDSLVILHLDVRPIPSLQYTDSMACSINPYYVLHLTDNSFSYSLRSTPSDSCFRYLPDSSLVYLYPHSNTTYYFTMQYSDEPYCTAEESRRFDSLGAVEVSLKILPEVLWMDQLDFRALDEGSHVRYREWYVNGNLLEETGPIIFGQGNPVDSMVFVTLIGHNLNCTDTASDSIPILRHSIFFPNIFTPSASTNNIFRPLYTYITNYQLWIYDRRGSLVFYSTDPDEGWDGTHEGRPVPQGAYVYTCKYDIPNASIQTSTGTVLLIR